MRVKSIRATLSAGRCDAAAIALSSALPHHSTPRCLALFPPLSPSLSLYLPLCLLPSLLSPVLRDFRLQKAAPVTVPSACGKRRYPSRESREVWRKEGEEWCLSVMPAELNEIVFGFGIWTPRRALKRFSETRRVARFSREPRHWWASFWWHSQQRGEWKRRGRRGRHVGLFVNLAVLKQGTWWGRGEVSARIRCYPFKANPA